MFVRATRNDLLSGSFVKSSLKDRCGFRSRRKNRFVSGIGSQRLRSSLSDSKASVPGSEVVGEKLENEVSNSESQETVVKERSTAYPFPEIEEKWQLYWKQNKTFRTEEVVDTSKPKFYVLDMFPYPSGSGLHVGHPEGYTATDIIARYKRAQGFNVLHPMGWDAFGLPAEQYALQTNTHPRITTERNINRFREQLQSLGFSYDWDREISTTDPSYYKWTQWIFLKLFEKGLAYQAEVPVNWCPELGTVLANEEVIDGRSERGNHPVVRLPMKQWMLKITEYADRLLDDLEDLDWSESIKDMQRNWIGRSEGAEILFSTETVDGEMVNLDVFTTRPDTIFGATYMVLAPEHKLLRKLTTDEQKSSVDEYITAASKKSDLERTGLQKNKTGVFTGSYARNPVSQEQIPIWVADYVLGSYGSGAIMAVPAHDERDYEFATKFTLPIRRVISSSSSKSEDTLPFVDSGICVNSCNQNTGLSIDGMDVKTASARVIDWLSEINLGSKKVNYKLRDWLFARQRYWGEPFPIIYPENSDIPVAISEKKLPLVLPDTNEFKPSGTPESPLANMKAWTDIYDTSPSNGDRIAKRETSTMPQWAGSCWYYLRFIDPMNNEELVHKDLEKYWMPVDLYIGGTEHAVLHLLYARFWHKVLYDLGVVSTKEPFQRLVSQGMILGEVEYIGYKDQDGKFVSEDAPNATSVKFLESEIIKKGSLCFLKSDPNVQVYPRSFKMSKSRGNVINPDDIVYQYGADSLRLYEMFMGPLRDTKVWSTRSVEGVHRFLSRVYRIYNAQIEDLEPTKDQLFTLHTTIKKVTEDTEGLRFNTAIACMMEFSNAAAKWERKPKSLLDPFLLLLAPYAPHLAEELWQRTGHSESLAYQSWPQWNEKHIQVENIELPIQINGKMRGTVNVAKDLDQDGALSIAMETSFIQKFLDGKDIKKVIYVQNRILNIVVK